MALFIGFAQCIAMWPGVSRSLVTIVGGVLVGLSLPAAVEYSFLLGVVTLGAATAYDGLKHGQVMLQTFDPQSLAIGLVFCVYCRGHFREVDGGLPEPPRPGNLWLLSGGAGPHYCSSADDKYYLSLSPPFAWLNKLCNDIDSEVEWRGVQASGMPPVQFPIASQLFCNSRLCPHSRERAQWYH